MSLHIIFIIQKNLLLVLKHSCTQIHIIPLHENVEAEIQGKKTILMKTAFYKRRTFRGKWMNWMMVRKIKMKRLLIHIYTLLWDFVSESTVFSMLKDTSSRKGERDEKGEKKATLKYECVHARVCMCIRDKKMLHSIILLFSQTWKPNQTLYPSITNISSEKRSFRYSELYCWLCSLPY